MDINEIKQYNQIQSNWYAAKTGISVDIQNIGKNDRTIALKATPSLKEIYDGVWLKTDVIEFEDGNFTNVYDFSWNLNNPKVMAEIHSEQEPYYLLDHFEKDPSLLGVINGSFFFLIDVVDKEPKDYPFHFCVRDGKVIGLLSSDEAIIYTSKDKLYAQKTRATGTMRINEDIITWVGSESKKVQKNDDSVVLYNSGSSKLIKVFDPKTGVRMGSLDNNHIHTPKQKGFVDLIVNKNEEGNLAISEITPEGGNHYFEGLFILHMPAKLNHYKLGDIIEPLTLDNLYLNTIDSGITVNKAVHDDFFKVPERATSRDARSVIAEDKSGNIHFVVFDGSKYIPKFKGVSANDILDYFPQETYSWAFFLDGGSSSRILTRENNEVGFHANEFAFKKITNETFLWDWQRHRKLASSIGLKIKKV